MASLNSIFNLAMLLKRIEDLKYNLSANYNFILLDSAYINKLSNDNVKGGNKRKKELLKRIKINIANINKLITLFNKALTKYFPYLRARPITPINFNEINNIIIEHNKPGKIAGEHTVLKIRNAINKTDQSIGEFIQSFDNLFLLFDYQGDIKTDKYTDKIIEEAFDIYSIGHFETALFLMGKCLDYLITKYLKLCAQKKIINYKVGTIQSWTFDTKINILKRHNLVTENDYSKIMSIKWDRNISGHPSTVKELKKLRNDSEAMIRLSVNQIMEISKKINSKKTQKGLIKN